ncbi:MAG: PspC domain-containing protein [Candidatus Nanosyncoccaceae bacterium]|jgi:phage shock protein C
MTKPKKLYRSKTDRKLTGLCGGLAEYWDYDSTIIRITFLALVLLSKGFFVWIYVIATILVPEKNKPSVVDKIANQPFEKTVDEIVGMAHGTPKSQQGLWVGIALIVLGVFALIRPFLPVWLKLDQLLLATILIGGGVLIIKKREEKK